MPQFTDLYWSFSPVCNNNIAVKDRCSLACLEQTVVCDATRRLRRKGPSIAEFRSRSRARSTGVCALTGGDSGTRLHLSPRPGRDRDRAAAFSSTALIYRASSTSHGQFPSRKPSVGVILKKPAWQAPAPYNPNHTASFGCAVLHIHTASS